jgi:hypothetical protein
MVLWNRKQWGGAYPPRHVGWKNRIIPREGLLPYGVMEQETARRGVPFSCCWTNMTQWGGTYPPHCVEQETARRDILSSLCWTREQNNTARMAEAFLIVLNERIEWYHEKGSSPSYGRYRGTGNSEGRIFLVVLNKKDTARGISSSPCLCTYLWFTSRWKKKEETDSHIRKSVIW